MTRAAAASIAVGQDAPVIRLAAATVAHSPSTPLVSSVHLRYRRRARDKTNLELPSSSVTDCGSLARCSCA